MEKILLFIMAIVMQFCTTQENIKIEEDSDVLKIYDENETDGLKYITERFDTLVIKNLINESSKYKKNIKINKAYHAYLDEVQSVHSFKDMKNSLKISDSLRTDIFEHLKSSGHFDEIWSYEYEKNYKTKDTISIALKLNLKGKYFRLLEILSKENVYLKSYVESIKDCSCIPPDIVAGFYKTHENYNFNREVNRLLFAVHSLTITSVKIDK